MATRPVGSAGTEDERRLNYDFYHRFAVISHDEFNGNLWLQSLPQMAHNEPAMWHLIGAIAAVFPNLPTGQYGLYGKKIYERGLQHYLSSVRSIRQMIDAQELSQGRKELILVHSPFLAMCEFWIGKKQSKVQSSAGIRLMRLWKSWEWQSCADPYGVTQSMLFLLKGHSSSECSHFVAPSEVWDWSEALSFLSQGPLRDYSSACLETEMLLASLHALFRQLPLQPDAAAIRTANAKRAIYKGYTAALVDRLRDFVPSTGRTEMEGIQLQILNIWCLLITAMLNVNLSCIELGWDEFCPVFEEVLLIAEKIYAQHDQSRVLPHFTPFLSKALHLMARWCREPGLRRRIISTFQRHPLHPANKGPRHYIPLVNTLQEIEEGAWRERKRGDLGCAFKRSCAAGKYVCQYHRVVSISLKEDPDLGRIFTFVTFGQAINKTPGKTVTLDAPFWG